MKYLLLLTVLLSTPAVAQQACAKQDEFAKMLADKFDEHRLGGGTANVVMMEVFVSKAGTFTIIQTLPNHVSCLVAAGDGWENDKVPGDKT